MEFGQVHVRNDWEYKTYSFNGVKLKEEPLICDVMWPNGEISVDVTFSPVSKSVSVFDHGHTYSVNQLSFVATFRFRGFPVSLNLEQFKIRNLSQEP